MADIEVAICFEKEELRSIVDSLAKASDKLKDMCIDLYGEVLGQIEELTGDLKNLHDVLNDIHDNETN